MIYSLRKIVGFFLIPLPIVVFITFLIISTIPIFSIEPSRILGDFYFNLQESIFISVWNFIKAATTEIAIPIYQSCLVTWILIYCIWMCIKKSMINIIKDSKY
ncbi:hypothetical protein COK63_04990 [Bacillus cereus]|nr:hypothetical protein CN393_01505 [Bacillus cereus]PFT46178.1 hypothetical protein COK63_04990 [Bacillus cereus]